MLTNFSEIETNLPSFSTLILLSILTRIPTERNNVNNFPPSNTSPISPDIINSANFSSTILVSLGNCDSALVSTSRPL